MGMHEKGASHATGASLKAHGDQFGVRITDVPTGVQS
jgi:hypothetical protein